MAQARSRVKILLRSYVRVRVFVRMIEMLEVVELAINGLRKIVRKSIKDQIYWSVKMITMVRIE